MLTSGIPKGVLRAVITTLLILTVSVLYLLAVTPYINPPDIGFSWQDKVYHASAFVWLSALFNLTMLAWWPKLKLRHVWIITMLFAASYGGFIEVSQLYIPNRDASVLDWVADMLGAIAGTSLIVNGFSRYIQR